MKRRLAPHAVLLVLALSTGPQMAQAAISTGCNDINTNATYKSPGLTGTPANTTLSAAAFRAGDMIRVTMTNYVAIDGFKGGKGGVGSSDAIFSNVLTFTDGGNATLFTLTSQANASASYTVAAAGLTGFKLTVNNWPAFTTVTGLVVACTGAEEPATAAAPAPVVHSSSVAGSATGRTQTTLNVQNIQKHINTLVASPAGMSTHSAGGGGNRGGGGTGGTGDTGGSGGTGDRENQFTGQGFSVANMGSYYQGAKGSRDSLKLMASRLQLDTAAAPIFAQSEMERDDAVERLARSGGGGGKFNVWGYGSFTDVENNRNRTNDDQRFDGDVLAFNVGADYRFRPGLVAGLAVGWSDTDLDTDFNTGTYDETNYTLSPYFLLQLNDWFTINGSAGYSWGDIDQDRTNRTVKSDTDSDSWFASLTATARHDLEQAPLSLIGRTSYLRSHKTVDGFTESDGRLVGKAKSNMSLVKAGGEAIYRFEVGGNQLHPFVGGDFMWDFQDTTNDDSTAAEIQGGIRFAHTDSGLSGSLEGSKLVGRDDFKQYAVRGLLVYATALPGIDGQFQPFLSANHDPDQLGMGAGFTHTLPKSGLELKLDLNRSMPTMGEENDKGMLTLHMPF